jgi:hypothetical protein
MRRAGILWPAAPMSTASLWPMCCAAHWCCTATGMPAWLVSVCAGTAWGAPAVPALQRTLMGHLGARVATPAWFGRACAPGAGRLTRPLPLHAGFRTRESASEPLKCFVAAACAAGSHGHPRHALPAPLLPAPACLAGLSGIYLPLLWPPSACRREPVALLFWGSHFSLLCTTEGEGPASPQLLPLCTRDGPLQVCTLSRHA